MTNEQFKETEQDVLNHLYNINVLTKDNNGDYICKLVLSERVRNLLVKKYFKNYDKYILMNNKDVFVELAYLYNVFNNKYDEIKELIEKYLMKKNSAVFVYNFFDRFDYLYSDDILNLRKSIFMFNIDDEVKIFTVNIDNLKTTIK